MTCTVTPHWEPQRRLSVWITQQFVFTSELLGSVWTNKGGDLATSAVEIMQSGCVKRATAGNHYFALCLQNQQLYCDSDSGTKTIAAIAKKVVGCCCWENQSAHVTLVLTANASSNCLPVTEAMFWDRCQCQNQRSDTELIWGTQSSVYPPQRLDKM